MPPEQSGSESGSIIQHKRQAEHRRQQVKLEWFMP